MRRMGESVKTNVRHSSIPEFVFVCGAVGSGNTFMFGSLTKDKHVYGINEDGLGHTMQNFLRPENASTCPHALDELVALMHRLRHDRRTLILKTPSNIRFATDIRKYFPSSRFIVMIREPHAAVVSGISRHGERYSIEDIARIWLSDYEHLDKTGDDSVVITFDELVSDPSGALSRVGEFLPLGDEVFTYANRVNRPDRSTAEWWKSKVDESMQREVERWVAELGLAEIYQAAQGNAGENKLQDGPRFRGAPARNRFLARLVVAKKELFRVWYRLTR